jgi:hypothetical protein
MKFGSTYYSTKQVSTCEIAGAIALCALHDLRVNLFRFGGFPHIVVEEAGEDFKVTISVNNEQTIAESFSLTRAEAFNAAKAFKKQNSMYDPKIFERVQIALARVVG